MNVKECLLLLPGYELDGFPRSASTEDADELLSGWVSMWHPALIAMTQCAPGWHQVEEIPNDCEDRIYVLPSVAKPTLQDAFRQKASESSGKIVDAQTGWRDMQVRLLAEAELQVPDIDDELLRHFAALGYAYLQIQLMTRQLRYSSSLDIPSFDSQLALAAEAAMAGNRDQAFDKLAACFDSLGQERDHYYSLDVQLVDLTLLAPTTLGGSLQRQLDNNTPTSFLASAELLRDLQRKSPDRLKQLIERVADLTASVVGGLEKERPHSLLTRDALVRDLARGRAAYQRIGVAPPTVFGRLGFGMSASTAAVLKRCGFDGCLLAALTGGRYPSGGQAKVTWESPDGTVLPALATEPLDASDPAGFLALGLAIGDALDHQHVPTILFAHWPGRVCDYYDLMSIVSQRTPALGRWITADRYFSETDDPYHQERFSVSEFSYNWLAETDLPAEMVIGVKEYHLLSSRIRALRTAANLCWQLENPPTKSSAPETSVAKEDQGDDAEADPTEVTVEYNVCFDFASELTELENELDGFLDEPGLPVQQRSERARTLAAQIDASSSEVLERLAAKLIGGGTENHQAAANGRLVFNPYCCPNRETIELDARQSFDASADWLFATGPVGKSQASRVDVPSCGFVAGAIAEAPQPRGAVLAQDGGLVRNEFVELQIDEDRGHLRGLYTPGHRGNRLSLQVARRRVDGQEPEYSEMDATSVRMLTSSNMNGLISATGHLIDKGKRIADFSIQYEVWRGSRIAHLDIHLSNLQPCTDRNPWRDAYVLRLAWVNESANLRAYSAGGRAAWSSGKTVAPEHIHIDETDYHTHYLTGGLAFHRLTGPRFLETILAADDCQEVRHRIGIGVDLPNPTEAASGFLHPPMQTPVNMNPGQVAAGWLATVNIDTVDLSVEAPLQDTAGRNVGIRLLASEDKGTSCGTNIRLLRDLKAAYRVDMFGARISELKVDGDQITIPLRANERALIDALWA